MEKILNLIFIVFAALAGISLIIYLPRLRGWFGSVKKQKKLVNEVKNKLAIIVPARNESKAIDDLLSSVTRQTYGRENFDLHVIVDNKNDPTIKKTEAIGGRIHVAENQTCKGDALDYCLKALLEENPDLYDGYIIIDADCMLSDDYLEQMNNALKSGRQVIQSKRVVKNYLIGKEALSGAACCNGLIWSIIDTLGNRYKSDRNITCMTIGTGIMLRADVVKMLGGWVYKQTLTEDIELMNDCALRKLSTFYYEHALLYLEESTSLRVTNKRRKRWLTGVIDSKRLYYKRLKAAAVSREDKRNKYFVTALYPVFFYVGACTLFGLAFMVIAAVLFITGSAAAWRSLAMGAICVGVIYVSFLLLTAVCMIADRKHIKLSFCSKLALLFTHPVFYMGYIPIIAKALFLKGDRCWEVIDRIDCKLSTGEMEEVVK